MHQQLFNFVTAIYPRRYEERLIASSEKPKQQLYVFPDKNSFFSKLLSFTVAKSLATNGLASLVYSRMFWIYLPFLVMLILQA